MKDPHVNNNFDIILQEIFVFRDYMITISIVKVYASVKFMKYEFH
ncbi:hypothetical protein YN1HA_8530 [Sulfurisphaera ohwakuensis]